MSTLSDKVSELVLTGKFVNESEALQLVSDDAESQLVVSIGSNVAALLQILIAKGICTEEEFTLLQAQFEQEMTQRQAQELMKVVNKEMPN